MWWKVGERALIEVLDLIGEAFSADDRNQCLPHSLLGLGVDVDTDVLPQLHTGRKDLYENRRKLPGFRTKLDIADWSALS